MLYPTRCPTTRYRPLAFRVFGLSKYCAMLKDAMKRLFAFLPIILLAGCASQPYNMKFGGNNVSAVKSSSAYTYVGDSFGFPYYGPYSWSWYDPVWYSPISGPHYRWHCPGCVWSDPAYRPGSGPGSHHAPPPRGKRYAGPAADYRRDERPLTPVRLEDVVVQSPKRMTYGKPMAYRSPDMKRRASYQRPKRSYSTLPSSPSAFKSSSTGLSASRPPAPRQKMPSKYSRSPN
jgi:hypothetical protein